MLALSRELCLHCGLATPPGHSFCCSGCETVHSLLVSKGLSHFYDLQEQYSFRKPSPITKLPSPISSDWAEIQDLQTRFYLEGIHCLGCLWLLEKLPEIEPRIQSAHFVSAQQILEIRIGPSIQWSEVIQLISQLGYSAKPLAKNNGEKIRRNDMRMQLARLGVAGFCSGNIMLLSVSIYAGTDIYWGLKFGWLSFILALPALLFSAWPLYKAALFPLFKGKLSVDLAIVFALLAGTAMSVWSLSQGSQENIYFDSLTTLIFLLLCSRFLLSRFRESISQSSTLLSYLSAERYQKIAPYRGQISAEKIKVGDDLKLFSGQTLPVDSMLISAEAFFDFSLLTGESQPVKMRQGDIIEAGAKLLNPAILRAQVIAKESRLARIMEQIRSYQLSRSPSMDFADRMGKYFVITVLSLAALLLFIYPNSVGIERALALVIVTCPCVLAFAVPLALMRGMQVAAGKGILFISPDKMEALALVKNLFLDKTGTLTTGQFNVLEWRQLNGDQEYCKAVAHALESQSPHPIAKALMRYTNAQNKNLSIKNYVEHPGNGVSAEIDAKNWRINKSANSISGKNFIELYCENILMAQILLGDAVRDEAPRIVLAFKKLGLKVKLLSGDNESNVSSIAKQLAIPVWKSNLLPEDKAKIVAKVGRAAMVGDGANDAVAFQAADIGVAMQGAVEISLKNSDLVLTKPGLESLLTAFILAKKSLRIVRINFAVTLAYNIFAGILAITGLMQPLWAAILMPLSALSVFALTQFQSRGQS